MQITEEQIERFLASQCTEEEADKVSAYLQENPSVLERYMKHRWDEAPYTGELPDGYDADMWRVIREDTVAKKQTGKWNSRLLLKIAAALLLIMGAWWMYEVTRSSASRQQTAAVQKDKKAVTLPEEITKVNTTGKDLKIRLPDRSIVTLSDGAGIKYAASFAVNNRDIQLNGVAFFEVVKDSTKPFTVFSGRFATTALGTSFSVAENKKGCTVKLYTGKVVIKATGAAIEGWNRNVFLTPHQQMHYDAGRHSVAVAQFGNTEKDALAKKNIKGSNVNTNKTMVFSETPLPEVMNKLMKRYNTRIKYNKTEIGNMYFSGSVLENDSLPLILNVIARMNRLEITQTADGFLVSRSK